MRKGTPFDVIVRPLKCPKCLREFISSSEYVTHVREHRWDCENLIKEGKQNES